MNLSQLMRPCGVLAASAALLAACAQSPQATAPTALPAATLAPSVVPVSMNAPATAQPAPTVPQPTTAAPAPTSVVTTVPTATVVAPPFSRTLQLADARLQGNDVQAVQQQLLSLGYVRVGTADGIFGPNTAAAVKAFQSMSKLDIDGIVGPKTWERLFNTDAAALRADVIVEAQHGWLLGGVQEGQWLDAVAAAGGVRGGASYKLFGGGYHPIGSAVGGEAIIEEEPCVDLTRVPLQFQVSDSLAPIGVTGSWNVLPRTPVELAVNTPAAQQAVETLLRENGITQPDVRVKRALRIDLEGDGTDELVVAATRYANAADAPTPDTAAGDYSLVAIVRSNTDGVSITPVVAEYYPQPKDFVAPNQHDLLGVLDLNGDGHMEIVLSEFYYEGASTNVYEVDGEQVTQVLGAGCGV
ncbi:MAG: peptidoglycan-binding protein [Chloroflexi bacterium SZAS-1]|nr:peptidoglycan-binding protein [Chloroflexi bacterium SZAS-1]